MIDIRFKIANLYSYAAFVCKSFSNNPKYNDKKICVPRHCDTDYNCPYPYHCKKDRCVKDKEDKKCTEDKGNQFYLPELRLIMKSIDIALKNLITIANLFLLFLQIKTKIARKIAIATIN